MTESASEHPTSESDDEWVEKTVDDKIPDVQTRDSYSQLHSRKGSLDKQRRESVDSEASVRAYSAGSEKEEASCRYRQASRPLEKLEKDSSNDAKIPWHRDTEKRKEYEKMSNKRSKDEKRHGRDVRRKREERERKLGNGRGSLEYSKDDVKRNHPTEKMETMTTSVAPCSSLSGDNFSHTHFSNDEISFINSLFRKNSHK